MQLDGLLEGTALVAAAGLTYAPYQHLARCRMAGIGSAMFTCIAMIAAGSAAIACIGARATASTAAWSLVVTIVLAVIVLGEAFTVYHAVGSLWFAHADRAPGPA